MTRIEERSREKYLGTTRIHHSQGKPWRPTAHHLLAFAVPSVANTLLCAGNPITSILDLLCLFHVCAPATMSTPFDIIAIVNPRPGKADRVHGPKSRAILSTLQRLTRHAGRRAAENMCRVGQGERARYAEVPDRARDEGRHPKYRRIGNVCLNRPVSFAPIIPMLCLWESDIFC